MTVKEKILALRLFEKQKKEPELARRVGINVRVIENKKPITINGGNKK